MTEISASLVKELRDKTGVGMMACKKALSEANGSVDEAIQLLRKRGEVKAGEKSGRSTSEGLIIISGRAIIKLLCETDFVARNEDFQSFANILAKAASESGINAATKLFEDQKTDKIQAIGENINLEEMHVLEGGDVVGGYVHSNGKLGALVALSGGTEDQAKDLAMHTVAMNPSVANPQDVPAVELEKEKDVYLEQLKNGGKPEQMIEKIIEGKIKKYCAERALSSQSFVKDPSITVADYLGKASLVNFIRFEV